VQKISASLNCRCCSCETTVSTCHNFLFVWNLLSVATA
jgi:hypothetical protein